MSKIKASIILPTYNEAGNIIKLVEELQKNLKQNKINHEIVVVDDDSPDKTGLLARKYFARAPEIRVIIRNKDKGLAASIRKGIEVCVGDVVVVMDTDFNHNPKLVPTLIKKCNTYDVAIGSRYVKGGGMANKTREIMSKYFNILLVKPIIGSFVNDNLCGFFAIRHELLEKLDFERIFFGYGDYFIRLIFFAKSCDAKFVEIPCFYEDRTYGVSKSMFLKMFWDYLKTAVNLRLNKE